MEIIEQLFKNFQNKLDKFKLMADYFNVLSYYADYLDDQEYQRFEKPYLQEARIFGVSSERLFGHCQFEGEQWLLNNSFISLFTQTDGLITDLFRDYSLSSENEILSTFFKRILPFSSFTFAFFNDHVNEDIFADLASILFIKLPSLSNW